MITCGVRWTISRSATSKLVMIPISATHATSGTSKEANFPPLDAAASTAGLIGAASTAPGHQDDRRAVGGSGPAARAAEAGRSAAVSTASWFVAQLSLSISDRFACQVGNSWPPRPVRPVASRARDRGAPTSSGSSARQRSGAWRCGTSPDHLERSPDPPRSTAAHAPLRPPSGDAGLRRCPRPTAHDRPDAPSGRGCHRRCALLGRRCGTRPVGAAVHQRRHGRRQRAGQQGAGQHPEGVQHDGAGVPAEISGGGDAELSGGGHGRVSRRRATAPASGGAAHGTWAWRSG